MYTVSWHIGDSVNQRHNRRDRKLTDKEEHINKNGFHKTIIDMDIKQAYRENFETALNEYNERIKSKHPERVKNFNQFYNEIKNAKNSNDKKLCYELIVQVGSAENNPGFNKMYDTYVKYLDEFIKNNKDMFVFGAYIHFDEQGAGHMHIDFFPVAKECTRGMKKQNSMNAVLKSQGFNSKHKNDSALIAWEKRERETFKNCARSFDLEIEKSKPSKREHLEKEDYILKKQIEQKANDIIDLQNKINMVKRNFNKIIRLEREILGHSTVEEQLARAINRMDYER